MVDAVEVTVQSSAIPVEPQASAKIHLLRPDVLSARRSSDQSAVAGRFCAWRGASDRRYVTTVFPVDRQAPDNGLPEFENFVLITVADATQGGARCRRILGVDCIERMSDRRTVVANALAHGTTEWHVYFVAEDRAARAAMATDLRDRHCRDVTARCA